MTGSDAHGGVRISNVLLYDPAPDHMYPAETLAKAIPTDNLNLNAILYTAAGLGPHPTVLLLHGLPGNEQNIDLAQSMRRAGWNVLIFHYRGSWGTPGTFSFEHCVKDSVAAADWLLGAVGDKTLRIDPTRVVAIGHSMGGFMAAYVAAARKAILGVALISPANLATAFALLPRREAVAVIDENVGTSEGLHILSGTSPEKLAREASDNIELWKLENYASAMAARPVLLITSDDDFTEGSAPYAAAVPTTGALTQVHLPTDHSYSDHRIALQTEVLRWLLGPDLS